jgi:hypothetical protein
MALRCSQGRVSYRHANELQRHCLTNVRAELSLCPGYSRVLCVSFAEDTYQNWTGPELFFRGGRRLFSSVQMDDHDVLARGVLDEKMSFHTDSRKSALDAKP